MRISDWSSDVCSSDLAKDMAETKAGLESGDIDIVVGTHALLGKAIKFKNLGLMIVDEEKHFGVGHKERLKQMRAEVHVLTLTATPMPRTLQLDRTSDVWGKRVSDRVDLGGRRTIKKKKK